MSLLAFTIDTSFFSSSMSLSFLIFFLLPCSETAAGSYLSRPTYRRRQKDVVSYEDWSHHFE